MLNFSFTTAWHRAKIKSYREKHTFIIKAHTFRPINKYIFFKCHLAQQHRICKLSRAVSLQNHKVIEKVKVHEAEKLWGPVSSFH